MAVISFDGMEAYKAELEAVLDHVPKMVNASLYDGSKILADAVQKEIDTLDELEPVQRQGLHDGLGVAHFWHENGATVTKVGFEGYNKKKTKRWPKGQPNAMIARTTIRGTSWLHANRFTARAAKKVRAQCVEAMAARFDKEVAKYTK